MRYTSGTREDSMNLNYILLIGIGIKTTTYFKLMLFYPYGDNSIENYVHLAVFGMN